MNLSLPVESFCIDWVDSESLIELFEAFLSPVDGLLRHIDEFEVAKRGVEVALELELIRLVFFLVVVWNEVVEDQQSLLVVVRCLVD